MKYRIRYTFVEFVFNGTMESRRKDHEEEFPFLDNEEAIKFYAQFQVKKRKWLRMTGQKARYDFHGLYRVEKSGKKERLVKVA